MKTIPNFPDYCIFRDGRVWSKTRIRSNGSNWSGRWLKPKMRRDGYLEVHLRKNSKHFYKLIHRLLLETYVGPCPKGMECRHLNGIRTDNRLINLCWGTRQENIFDAIRHGTHRSVHQEGEKNKMAKLTDEKVRVILYLYRIAKFSFSDLAWQFDVHSRTIRDICKGITWKHLLKDA